jgi:glutamate synthase domain-containing protein 2
VLSAFHLFRVLALGADTVNSARAMMLALGCIQSKSCNTDKCPTGVATQDPSRYRSLDVPSKGQRIANYQSRMVHHLIELLEVAGLNGLDEIRSRHVSHRVGGPEVKTYAEIYPAIETGCLIQEETVPPGWLVSWQHSAADRWDV